MHFQDGNFCLFDTYLTYRQKKKKKKNNNDEPSQMLSTKDAITNLVIYGLPISDIEVTTSDMRVKQALKGSLNISIRLMCLSFYFAILLGTFRLNFLGFQYFCDFTLYCNVYQLTFISNASSKYVFMIYKT